VVLVGRYSLPKQFDFLNTLDNTCETLSNVKTRHQLSMATEIWMQKGRKIERPAEFIIAEITVGSDLFQ
jgi:hypothetical protein